jgi:hypothetical protein
LLRLGALGREARDDTRLPASLRSYLYEKYVYRHATPTVSGTAEEDGNRPL